MIPDWYRKLSFGVACMQNITMSGLIFGWVAIAGNLLTAPESEGGAGLARDQVNQMFVFACFANFMGPIILGLVLDTCGPRCCSVLACLLIGLGCLFFAISDADQLNLYILGACFIAFGGAGAQNATIHLSNLFPTWKATATAVLIGCAHLSPLIFFIFNQLYQYQHYSCNTMFKGYAVICGANVVASLLLWPDDPFTFEEQLEEKQIVHSSGPIPIGPIRLPSVLYYHKDSKKASKEKERAQFKGTFFDVKSSIKLQSYLEVKEPPIKNQSLVKQVFSAEFQQLALFFAVHSFWINFYIGVFDVQLGDVFAAQLTYVEQQELARTFSWCIATGVVAVPVMGLLMDRVGFPLTSLVLVASALAWCICVMNGSVIIHIPI